MSSGREVERLSSWADESGGWVDPATLGQWFRGRREHDLFGEGSGGHIFKITRGVGFGLIPEAREVVSGYVSDWFCVMPATPSQYLARLALGNHLYPGLNSLEGIGFFEGRFGIVTSQPFIAGRNATGSEIRAFMAARRFVPICEGTWFRSEDGLAIFDVGGSNLFASECGELVPIDVIPIRADGALLDRLTRAARRSTL